MSLVPEETAEGVRVRGVSKRYGKLLACDSIDLFVQRGEIRGILGENGAGKSTLMKIITGLVRPTSGAVSVWGETLEPGSWASAYGAGVRMVHQNLSLVGGLSVWENIALGAAGEKARSKIAERVEQLAAELGFEVPVDARVGDLRPSVRQRVEILKCLWEEPRVVILDEPTSVLSRSETEDLFRILGGNLLSKGVAVLLVSHRLDELVRFTDAVTVLRRGSIVDTYESSTTSPEHLGEAMLGSTAGRSLAGPSSRDHSAAAPRHEQSSNDTGRPGDPVLCFRSVTTTNGHRTGSIQNVSFDVCRGEILGVAGVEGSGQEVLVDLISGLTTPESGELWFSGEPYRIGAVGCPGGIGVIPSDRMGSALIRGMSIYENLAFGRLKEFRRFGLLSRKRMLSDAARRVSEYNVVAGELESVIETLSGGNQQKIVLARALSIDPSLVVASQPTQGLDAGAMNEMWRRLAQVAERGAGVLLISSEIDELLTLADRIAVLFDGRMSGVVSRKEATSELLGSLMGGASIVRGQSPDEPGEPRRAHGLGASVS